MDRNSKPKIEMWVLIMQADKGYCDSFNNYFLLFITCTVLFFIKQTQAISDHYPIEVKLQWVITVGDPTQQVFWNTGEWLFEIYLQISSISLESTATRMQ